MTHFLLLFSPHLPKGSFSCCVGLEITIHTSIHLSPLPLPLHHFFPLQSTLTLLQTPEVKRAAYLLIVGVLAVIMCPKTEEEVDRSVLAKLRFEAIRFAWLVFIAFSFGPYYVSHLPTLNIPTLNSSPFGPSRVSLPSDTWKLLPMREM